MICNKVFGEKEPFEDKSETHGLCDICFPKEMEKLKRESKRLREEKMRKNPVMRLNPRGIENLQQKLKSFIKEERDAVREYSRLAKALESMNAPRSIINEVLEIVKDEAEHSAILEDILWAAS